MNHRIIDIGILTIREDEFRAVLKVFQDDHDICKGRHREYTLRTADAGQGARYRLAILRQIEQGNGEAQDAARDLIDDLQPSLFLVVGIAGGLPSDDISLGDVVLSTRVLDFSIEARKFQEDTTYNVGGGPIAKSIAAGVANLGARELDLGDWWAELPSKPAVSLAPGKLYGPKRWQQDVRAKLQLHHGKNVPERTPTFSAGPIASSDRLVKDPRLLFPWIASARGILAIEMESAGVHRATRDKTPMLSIRGLSDIVGFKRQDAWTKYACASAAAFARGYLRTRPVPVRQLTKSDLNPVTGLNRGNSDKDTDQQTIEEERLLQI
jgi:nucleoside phosphorylase